MTTHTPHFHHSKEQGKTGSLGSPPFTRSCPQKKPLGGYDKKNQIPSNKARNSEKKQRIGYLHNYRLKFPLKQQCKQPFKPKLKVIQLNNSKQYHFKTKKFYIKQTTKNLIIYPKFEAFPGTPGNSQQAAAKLRAKCLAFVKSLCTKHPGLLVFRPEAVPSSQEFAFKDKYAERLPFTFRNEVGKFDKSERIDSDGFKVTGGETEFFTPEAADTYLRMPSIVSSMASTFSESLKEYNANIRLHLATLQDMRDCLRAMKPKRERMPTGFKRSATVKGVS